MGNVHYIAKTNDFWVQDLHAFKDGIKGYLNGEFETPIHYNYSDYKKRSKKALINMSDTDFSTDAWKEGEEEPLDLLTYIQSNLVEGEECVIHLVSYEHANDMSISKYVVNKESINEHIILD